MVSTVVLSTTGPVPGARLSLRNREGEANDGALAGIAAVAVSTDAAFDPYTVYDPYP